MQPFEPQNMNSDQENPLKEKKGRKKPQEEQQKRDPSLRTDRAVTDVVCTE